ncbi:MAG: cytochrome c biogenesis protein CcsA [Thermodesulfobacteriota bacterium]
MASALIYLTLIAYFGATALWLGFFLAQRENFCRGGVWLLGLGLLFNTLELIFLTWSKGYLPVATFGETLLVTAWALAAAFLILYWCSPIKVLGALTAPLAAIMVSGALLLAPGHGVVSPALKNIWLTVHIVLALLGNAALTLAFLAGIFYLVQERQLKKKNFGFFYRRLPSLEQLDAINYWCLTIGFPLLTAGIITGSLFAQHVMGSFWQGDPKEILTLLAWLIYAVLLHERLAVGWRGRRAALLAICGFIVLLVTFVGANLWFSSFHNFASFLIQP